MDFFEALKEALKENLILDVDLFHNEIEVSLLWKDGTVIARDKLYIPLD